MRHCTRSELAARDAQLRDLAARVGVVAAAKQFGLGRTRAFEIVRAAQVQAGNGAGTSTVRQTDKQSDKLEKNRKLPRAEGEPPGNSRPPSKNNRPSAAGLAAELDAADTDDIFEALEQCASPWRTVSYIFDALSCMAMNRAEDEEAEASE